MRPSDQLSHAELIARAANGNEQAAKFLAAFVRRAHLLDDIEDKDKIVTAEQLAQSESEWMIQLACNDWFQANKGHLVPIMCLALSAWLDSNRMEPGPARGVLKGYYHEVINVTALLTGGFTGLRDFTSQHRAYDLEEQVAINGKERHGVLHE